MNVRFFGGTKREYLSIAKHNPQALYFCQDTQELFWGDLCLSDGVRVVETKLDLPLRSDAADGIVYYVRQTRNGYTLSPDRTEWLQTIYAPATDAYAVPESEIYNTVTTVGAVRDVEDRINEKIEAIKKPILGGYATKAELEEVKDSIPSIENLASIQFVIDSIEDIKVPTKVSELENDAQYVTV